MRYRRARAAGGTYFFPVNLADRGGDILVRYIDDLRSVMSNWPLSRWWEHQIRYEVDLTQHVDNIHFNPVKYGWVNRPADWPHSTPHGYIKRRLVPVDWGGHSDNQTAGYGER